MVVAFGGDGTVNEAANGLLGSRAPRSCCLPGGSANVFGKMLGIPGDVVDATEHLLAMADDWRPRKVDLGVVNGRCFTFASGLGLDASVVERVDANPRLKARLGAYYFTWVAVTHVHAPLPRAPAAPARAGRTGETLEGVTAIVQNGSPFTYFQNRPIEIADGAALDSGTLAGGVLHRATLLSMPSIAWRALLAPRARDRATARSPASRELDELTVAQRRRAPAAAAGRRRLPRRGRRGALLDPARGADRRLLRRAALAGPAALACAPALRGRAAQALAPGVTR